MSERSSAPSARPMRSDSHRDLPSPDIVEFIRHCHRRRSVGWPEMYDEMCAVAARREFKGWDHGELARRGVSFTLDDMPRLAAWVRIVLAASTERPQALPVQPAAQASAQPAAG